MLLSAVRGIAFALCCAVVGSLAFEPAADAQVWRPKGRRGKRQAPAPDKTDSAKHAEKKHRSKRRAARKSRTKAMPKKAKPAEDVLDEDEDERAIQPDPDSIDRRASSDDDANDSDDDADDSDDDAADADDSDDDWPDVENDRAAGDSFTMDDALGDVGPSVRISNSDLIMDATGRDTRLEARAMTYARAAIDTGHDAVPADVAGVTPLGEEVLSFRWHGRAEGITRFGRWLKVKVAGRFDAELGLDSNTQRNVERFEAEVWDTYGDLFVAHVDLRFGKQLVTWGTADLLSPNDVINPRDLRRGFLERPEELRRPLTALKLRAYDGPLSASAIWVPVAAISEFELLDSDFALLGPNSATALERRVGTLLSALQDDPMLGLAFSRLREIDQEPDFGIDSGELGANVALQLPSLDLHGYFFWGHERTPRVQIAPTLQQFFSDRALAEITPEALSTHVQELAAMGIAAVETTYPRRFHLGGALATRFEPIGIKLDAAYTVGATTSLVTEGDGPLLASTTDLDRFAGTISVDYDRGTNLTVVVEANYTRVFHVPSGQSVYQLDGDELTLIGGRLEWKPRSGPVTLKLLGFAEAKTDPGYAVHPAIRLSGHDNLSLEIGAMIYGGPAVSFAGAAGRNDQVHVTVQYGL